MTTPRLTLLLCLPTLVQATSPGQVEAKHLPAAPGSVEPEGRGDVKRS